MHLCFKFNLMFFLDPYAGGEIEVQDLKLKAEEICAIPNTDQPFMCLDVSYIALLLEEAFALPAKTKVKVRSLLSHKQNEFQLNNILFVALQKDQQPRDLVGAGLCVQSAQQIRQKGVDADDSDSQTNVITPRER